MFAGRKSYPFFLLQASRYVIKIVLLPLLPCTGKLSEVLDIHGQITVNVST